MNNTDFQQLNAQLDDMRRSAKEMADEVRRWQQDFSWSDWEPHIVGVIPMRINGRWYWKGDIVYRKEKIRYLGASHTYKYGDEFDVLKDNYDNVS